MVNPQRALADTSVFIGLEAVRFDSARFADYEWGVSAITLGELRLGVLQARDPEAAARRLSTYQLAQRFEPLPVDEAVSEAWALLVSRLRAAGRKAPINDSWIAATALAYDIPVVTQDADYDEMPGIKVVKL
ncbi:type II toxin-antitoxin system VapC family toxin [Planobispora takensis]|uniref:Ribonuclease VapC n=1 Tax=Planobispora takensis TaxID=1367882 RepID=A0A8J3T0T6_9ACTN|nr:type II toxin-antitoxin system VapC family toxin [Planobispora takensis]GII02967.1 toxin VapC4 [Planobispora takensis]